MKTKKSAKAKKMVSVHKISDAAYIAAAKRLYASEGSVDIDFNAKVSHGDDDGAYVQAWVWVYNKDTE